MSVDTSIEDQPHIHQPDQFDLCQGHSSNWHFHCKSMGSHLKRHIIMKPLGLGVPYQTCRHLTWVLQGIPKFRSLRPHFLILWAKVEFSHYNQCDSQMSINHLPFEVETWYLHPRCIMIRPLVAFHNFDLDLVFKVTMITESFDTGIGRFLSWLKIHLLKIYPTYINQTSLTSVKVTIAIDIFNGNQWVFTWKDM